MNFSDREDPTRLDGFYDGRFHLVQPARSGYRAGLDALLLAATVPADASGEAVDLGAGTGAIGFAAVFRAPSLRLTLAESNREAASMMRESAAYPQNAALAARLSVAEIDVLAPRPAREAAGLREGSFDLVLTNPPFYPAGYRSSPDAARRVALSVPEEDFLARWMRVAASLLRRRGRLAAILRPADLPAVSQALENRLGALTVLPVHTRPGAATRILLGATKGSRAGLSILPGLTLFEGGEPANEISRAIAEGRQGIDLFP